MAENETKPNAPKAGPQPNANRAGAQPSTATDDVITDAPTNSAPNPGRPMTSASMDAPVKADGQDQGQEQAQPQGASAAAGRTKPPTRYGAMPGPDELAKLRKAKFGDRAGTVRIDAAPPNAGPDAPATQLVYVDGNGFEVGREDYVPNQGNR